MRTNRNIPLPNKSYAFTLVEMLAVIVLIGLLAVFVVPRVLERVGPAKHATAVTQIVQLQSLLSLFNQDIGRYPSQSEGLEALLECPPGLSDKWKGPYGSKRHLTDPWGNSFEYRQPGTQNKPYDIICHGADGLLGGEGDKADISNE